MTSENLTSSNYLARLGVGDEVLEKHYLVDTARKRIVSSINCRRSTAERMNALGWMKSRNLRYVLDLQEGFQWE